LEQALTQPQIIHRNTFSELSIPEIGNVKLFNMTAKFEKTPGMVEQAPPLLSQHSTEILLELGYELSQIKQLSEEGII